jgi:hypothetical protein
MGSGSDFLEMKFEKGTPATEAISAALTPLPNTFLIVMACHPHAC